MGEQINTWLVQFGAGGTKEAISLRDEVAGRLWGVVFNSPVFTSLCLATQAAGQCLKGRAQCCNAGPPEGTENGPEQTVLPRLPVEK